MLDRLKNLFSPPNKEEETMAATSQKQAQKATDKNFSQTCSLEAVEQLSITSDMSLESGESGESGENCCETQIQCEDSVREKAYLLWEAAGYPEGDGVDFWLQAEQALSSEDA